MSHSATLLIHCPDRKGIVAAVSGFLYSHGANILHADQHQDNELGLFFMRIEWALTDFALDDASLRREFRALADQFQMHWELAYSAVRPNVGIFVSRYEHCLLDLLYRHKIGELPCRIPLIISNHTATQDLARFYGIPFYHIPVNTNDKARAEREQLELLERHEVELIVLARYMQILSAEFVARYPQRIINVHHSFLPAFSGARPYHAAYQRGVKLIGATSHYVTEMLDEGPIIEQDVLRVSHRDQIDDLIQKGRDLEQVVLSRAVQWHLQHRILHYAGKTVIFD
ncbi:MAG: formyltetrahydrofolate deformylase [Acidobacteriaceae bacterium]|nr:formyltetrahydrofolate deformylase [Acidobacteriaceae bacterium]